MPEVAPTREQVLQWIYEAFPDYARRHVTRQVGPYDITEPTFYAERFAALAFAAGQSAAPEHINFLRRWLINAASESSTASRPAPTTDSTGADVLTEEECQQLRSAPLSFNAMLQAAARIGAERERERAARVCEAQIAGYKDPEILSSQVEWEAEALGEIHMANQCAAAIRRGEE